MTCKGKKPAGVCRGGRCPPGQFTMIRKGIKPESRRRGGHCPPGRAGKRDMLDLAARHATLLGDASTLPLHVTATYAGEQCSPLPAPANPSELRLDPSTPFAALIALGISRVKAKPLRGGLRPALTLLVTAVRKLTAAMTQPETSQLSRCQAPDVFG